MPQYVELTEKKKKKKVKAGREKKKRRRGSSRFSRATELLVVRLWFGYNGPLRLAAAGSSWQPRRCGRWGSCWHRVANHSREGSANGTGPLRLQRLMQRRSTSEQVLASMSS